MKTDIPTFAFVASLFERITTLSVFVLLLSCMLNNTIVVVLFKDSFVQHSLD